MLQPDIRVSFLQNQKHNCPSLLMASEHPHPNLIGTLKKTYYMIIVTWVGDIVVNMFHRQLKLRNI